MLTAEEKRRQVLETVGEVAAGLVKADPDITRMVHETHLTIGEMALVFEERLRKEIPQLLEDSGYHAGQAAHQVRSERIHAQVAEMAAGA
jgi:hypothetical protein